ncbi:hypothetical protein A2U01_0119223, partial [Trifolium medium]|nr:hypothetical protein [Trifolium medium]
MLLNKKQKLLSVMVGFAKQKANGYNVRCADIER